MYIKTIHSFPTVHLFHMNHAVHLNTVAPNRKKIHRVRQESVRKFYWNLDFCPNGAIFGHTASLHHVRVLFAVPTVKVVTCSCEIKCKSTLFLFALSCCKTMRIFKSERFWFRQTWLQQVFPVWDFPSGVWCRRRATVNQLMSSTVTIDPSCLVFCCLLLRSGFCCSHL